MQLRPWRAASSRSSTRRRRSNYCGCHPAIGCSPSGPIARDSGAFGSTSSGASAFVGRTVARSTWRPRTITDPRRLAVKGVTQRASRATASRTRRSRESRPFASWPLCTRARCCWPTSLSQWGSRAIAWPGPSVCSCAASTGDAPANAASPLTAPCGWVSGVGHRSAVPAESASAVRHRGHSARARRTARRGSARVGRMKQASGTGRDADTYSVATKRKQEGALPAR